MTAVKAKLTVTLKADEVTVAEVDDAPLWQRVLTAIQTGKTDLLLDNGGIDQLIDPSAGKRPPRPAGGDPIDKLAAEIGLDRAVVEGACSPTTDPPFLHLNAHCWQAMRKQLPVRGGTYALNAIAAASTLLALWVRAAGLPAATQAQALTILDQVGAEDKNPSRGVKRATWLNTRGRGQILLNPSEISDAVILARCFCSKSWTEWKTRKAKDE